MTVELAAGVTGYAEEIPVLDLEPFLAGEAGAAERLASELRFTQENIGFYFVINHGVDMALIRNGYDQLAKFFALPMEEKLKLRASRTRAGYVPPKSVIYVTSPINKNTKPDLNEVLRYVNERPQDHPGIKAGRRFHGPNPWPESLPGFRETIKACHEELASLGRRLLPLYAMALDKPADYFTPFFEDPLWTTRNSHYPVGEAEENQFGIAPHQDAGFMTLLPLSDVPGLEIRTRAGNWINADHMKGDAIIVNTGEFLNRWTNGRFLASPHRVRPPERDRYSMALFFNPSPDAVAEPLDTCVSDDHPPIFEPISLYDYVCWYVDRNYPPEAG
ncbi:MAG: isopenicillin N synthase family oxygenase, partial [Gammaproteobacteria bacterium]|nr:isopenicillin N synthase family oxygenase [Gammaproteobacteria bacterium]